MFKSGAWADKGQALYELGQYAEAVKCYDKAIEINPNNANAWKNKGLALYKSGHHAEAAECFKKAEELGFSEAR